MAEKFYSLEKLGYPMYSITKTGLVWSNFRHRTLVPKIHRDRYLFVRLLSAEGKWQNRYIHRLVALMFIPSTDTTLQIDHIDGNKKNNNVTNLRWVTNRENAHAAMHNGLMPHAVFKSDEVVHSICQAIQNGEGVASISRRTGYPYHSINAIKLRRNWTHISKFYTFPVIRDRNVTDDSVVHRICQLILMKRSDSEISSLTGIKKTLIHMIRTGKNFSRISSLYFKPENVCRTI